MNNLFKPNWKRGEQYFWGSKATLALAHLIPLSYVRLYTKKPDTPEMLYDYHRVKIEVVHTKKEARQLKREWEKRKAEWKQQSELAQAKAAKAAKTKATCG